MPTRREYLIRAAVSFALIPVLCIIMYPLLPPDQRRGAYITVGLIVAGLAVLTVIALAIKVSIDRKKRSGSPPRAD